jgi:predicted transposase YdaD
MTHQHHDAFFKAVFRKPGHATAHLAAILPPALVAALDLSRARLVKGSFIDDKLHESHTDLLFRVPRRNAPKSAPVYLYLLFEHQSTMDPLMPLRLLRYELNIWQDHTAKFGPSAKLPPIIPVVFYHGERPWTAHMDVFDMIDVTPAEAEALRPFGPHTGYLVEDLGRADDRDFPGTGLPRVALLVLKHIWRKGLYKRVVNLDVQLQAVLKAGGSRELGFVLHYLFHAGDPADHAGLKQLVARLGPVAQELYMTIAEQVRQEAALKARKEGRKDTQLEVAAKALAKGLSVSEVAELTGLTVDEVRALAH